MLYLRVDFCDVGLGERTGVAWKVQTFVNISFVRFLEIQILFAHSLSKILAKRVVKNARGSCCSCRVYAGKFVYVRFFFNRQVQ